MDPTDATRSKARYFQNPMDDYTTWNPVFNVGGPIIKNKLSFFSGFMPTTTNTNRTVTFLHNRPDAELHVRRTSSTTWSNKLDFMPFSKLRMNASQIWNPNYTRALCPRARARLPDHAVGSCGKYTAGKILSGQMDYLATSKLIAQLPRRLQLQQHDRPLRVSEHHLRLLAPANHDVSDLPPDLQRTAAGWVTQDGAQPRLRHLHARQPQRRRQLHVQLAGQHNLKGGWQTNRLSNSVQNLSYPTGYYRYYWDQSYTCVTTQCSGKQRGTYGYYRWYTYGDNGDASSNNQGSSSRTTGGSTSTYAEPRPPHGTRIPAQLLQAGHRRGASDRIRLGQQDFAAHRRRLGSQGRRQDARLRVVGLLLRRDEVRDAARQLRRRHLHHQLLRARRSEPDEHQPGLSRPIRRSSPASCSRASTGAFRPTTPTTTRWTRT